MGGEKKEEAKGKEERGFLEQKSKRILKVVEREEKGEEGDLYVFRAPG